MLIKSRSEIDIDKEERSLFGFSKWTLVTIASVAVLAVIICKLLGSLFGNINFNSYVKEPVLDTIFVASESSGLGRLANIVAWFAFGGVLYILVWFFMVLVIDIYNNVAITSSFIHPKSFHSSDIWIVAIGRIVLRLAGAIVLFSAVMLTIRLIPYWFYNCSRLGMSVSLVENIKIVSSCVLSMFVLQCVALLSLRLTFLRRHIAY